MRSCSQNISCIFRSFVCSCFPLPFFLSFFLSFLLCLFLPFFFLSFFLSFFIYLFLSLPPLLSLFLFLSLPVVVSHFLSFLSVSFSVSLCLSGLLLSHTASQKSCVIEHGPISQCEFPASTTTAVFDLLAIAAGEVTPLRPWLAEGAKPACTRKSNAPKCGHVREAL